MERLSSVPEHTLSARFSLRKNWFLMRYTKLMIKSKKTHWIVAFILIATVINGLLAGGNVDRSVVAMPAWHQVGLSAWANFSRYADLGSGQVFYPIMAISGTVLTVFAAILFILTGRRPRSATVPLYLAAICMLVALPISLKATPFMLSLRHINNHNVSALQQAFTGFEYWGRLQGLLHVFAFGINLWSLIAVSQQSNDKSIKVQT